MCVNVDVSLLSLVSCLLSLVSPLSVSLQVCLSVSLSLSFRIRTPYMILDTYPVEVRCKTCARDPL